MAQELKKQIMRRVYLAFIMRKFTSPLAMKMYALGALIFISTLDVSFPHVFANMPRFSDPHVIGFSVSAFDHTELLVKILAVAALATILFMMRDIARFFPYAFAGTLRRIRG